LVAVVAAVAVVAQASRAPRRPGGPIVIGGSHYLAPTGGYFPNLLGQEGVAEDVLVERALAEVTGGADWVKVVADSPMGPTMFFDAPSNYHLAAVTAMVDAVRAAGGRVAAHVSGPNVRTMIEAGVDSVEHGNDIGIAEVTLMAERGTAWTPTLGTVLAFCDGVLAEPDHPLRAQAGRTRDQLAAAIPEAARRGVTILAGTDLLDHGDLASELVWLVRLGLAPVDALRSATTVARAFFGLAGMVEGAPADIVTYDSDPRDDPDVLRKPVAIVLHGRRYR
jgi:imidazolonepropionase-like amidohydrolase